MNQQPRHSDEKFGRLRSAEVDVSLTPSGSWPEAGFEEVTWDGGTRDFNDLGYISGMRGRNYKAFVPPGIADISYAPSSVVASLAEEAGARVGPFATIMLRSESVASSQIENLAANARILGEGELGTPTYGTWTPVAILAVTTSGSAGSIGAE